MYFCDKSCVYSTCKYFWSTQSKSRSCVTSIVARLRFTHVAYHARHGLRHEAADAVVRCQRLHHAMCQADVGVEPYILWQDEVCVAVCSVTYKYV